MVTGSTTTVKVSITTMPIMKKANKKNTASKKTKAGKEKPASNDKKQKKKTNDKPPPRVPSVFELLALERDKRRADDEACWELHNSRRRRWSCSRKKAAAKR